MCTIHLVMSSIGYITRRIETKLESKRENTVNDTQHLAYIASETNTRQSTTPRLAGATNTGTIAPYRGHRDLSAPALLRGLPLVDLDTAGGGGCFFSPAEEMLVRVWSSTLMAKSVAQTVIFKMQCRGMHRGTRGVVSIQQCQLSGASCPV